MTCWVIEMHSLISLKRTYHAFMISLFVPGQDIKFLAKNTATLEFICDLMARNMESADNHHAVHGNISRDLS